MAERICVLLAAGRESEALSARVAAEAQAAGFEAARFSALEALLDALRAARAGSEPTVVVIGPYVERPLAAARRVRQVWDGHLMLAPAPEAVPALRRELALAPRIGENWSLCHAGEQRLAGALADAARASAQRRQLRTTLDRANLRLRARESVDAGRYRALFLSDRYLATLLRQAGDPIVSLDATNAVSAWNRGAEEVFGLPAARALGMPATGIARWPARLGEALAEARSSTDPVAAGFILATSSGERHFQASVSAVRDDAGGYIGAAILMHDVSAAARALAAEQAARSHAEQMSRMKDEFLATLSHELRTPLSAVLSWAQVLQATRADPELQQGLEAIQRNARIQAQLIDDLLDVSRIITGQPFLDVQPVSMVDIAERSLAVVTPAARAKGIVLAKRYEAGVPPVQGDGKRLQQVLWNLLANAVKFTPQGGSIEIRVGLARSGVEIAVSDSGQGIAPQFLPHLFERFRQADASIRRAHGGLGLGLAIVKQLVELHGGTVSGASDGPGRGATFTVRLPVAATLRDARAGAAPEARDDGETEPPLLPPGVLGGVRVLVVEDEADSRVAVERILQHWGARTASAGSVEEALDVLDEFRPQILVSDVGMPGRDGFDLVRTLRRRGIAPEALPAIALTAYARREDIEEAFASGFQQHVPKPTDARRLVNAVHALARHLQ